MGVNIAAMDEETCRKELRIIDDEIAETEQTIKQLENDIEECRSALEHAKKMKFDFDNFIAIRRQKNSNQVRGGLTKMFSSFTARVNDLLTGPEYISANGNLEELIAQLASKLRKLLNDLNFCETELRMQNKKRMELVSLLMMGEINNVMERNE